MNGKLEGKKVAILATDGFSSEELMESKKALETAGADTVIIAPKLGHIRGWRPEGWGNPIAVDKALGKAKPDDYDALLLPGGVINPDRLRVEPKAVEFVREMAESGKPVGAIGHGPWMLVEAGVIKGKTLTSSPSLKTDIWNAGAGWTNEKVVTDRNITTGRKAEDLPAFTQRIVEEFGAPPYPVEAAS